MRNSQKKVNFSIVGCGRIAERHAKHIINLGTLVAVCDIKKERADRFAQEAKAKAYYNIDDLLKFSLETEVVSICTPNALHAEQTIKALRAGFHVLCEKPMAITVRDCEAMIKTSERENKKLFIVKQNRYNPPVAAVKKIIDEGRLGKIYNVQLNCFWNRSNQYYQESDWKGTKHLDGGTLYTQFSHFIDLLYWMIGDIVDIQAQLKNFSHKNVIEFEDSGVVLLKFDNGAIGTINYSINSYNKNMEGSLTIIAEKGTVKIGGQYLNVLEYQAIENYKITGLAKNREANDYGAYQGSMSNHDKVYENVLEVLNYNGKILTSGLDGLKTVEIIERIYNQSTNI